MSKQPNREGMWPYIKGKEIWPHIKGRDIWPHNKAVTKFKIISVRKV